jgi:hypothetical protein
MNLPGLRLFSWSVRYLFVPASMRMSGDQDRAARHPPREETAHRMTLEHKYLAVALGMLALAVAILMWWAPR